MPPSSSTKSFYDIASAQDTTNKEKYEAFSKYAQLQQMLAGGVSGCLTRTLTQPFDVLKIRFQLQVEPLKPTAKAKYSSIIQACRMIYREEGIRGLWKGHNSGQFMSITYAIVQFWSYEQIHHKLAAAEFFQHKKNLPICYFLSGALSGVFATTVAMPFDVIRTRIVAQDPGAGYQGTISAFATIVKKEGVRGLFRGLVPTVIQIFPLVGANFMFYKTFNHYATKFLRPPDGLLPTWVLLVTGGTSGCVSKALVYPLDFIKKRLQVVGFEEQRRTFGQNQSCRNSFECIRLTIKHEGALGFYKGMAPTLLKSGATAAFYFTIYDITKLILIKHF